MSERPTKHDNYKTLSCTLVINDYKITLTRVRLDLTKHNRHPAPRASACGPHSRPLRSFPLSVLLSPHSAFFPGHFVLVLFCADHLDPHSQLNNWFRLQWHWSGEFRICASCEGPQHSARITSKRIPFAVWCVAGCVTSSDPALLSSASGSGWQFWIPGRRFWAEFAQIYGSSSTRPGPRKTLGLGCMIASKFQVQQSWHALEGWFC